MSLSLKQEPRKSKNSTYQSLNNNSYINNSKNDKLSFSTAFRNNTQKIRLIQQGNGNSTQKRTKNHTINHHEHGNIQNIKSSKIKQEPKEDNFREFENLSNIQKDDKEEDEENPKRVLNNVESY